MPVVNGLIMLAVDLNCTPILKQELCGEHEARQRLEDLVISNKMFCSSFLLSLKSNIISCKFPFPTVIFEG